MNRISHEVCVVSSKFSKVLLSFFFCLSYLSSTSNASEAEALAATPASSQNMAETIAEQVFGKAYVKALHAKSVTCPVFPAHTSGPICPSFLSNVQKLWIQEQCRLNKESFINYLQDNYCAEELGEINSFLRQESFKKFKSFIYNISWHSTYKPHQSFPNQPTPFLSAIERRLIVEIFGIDDQRIVNALVKDLRAYPTETITHVVRLYEQNETLSRLQAALTGLLLGTGTPLLRQYTP